MLTSIVLASYHVLRDRADQESAMTALLNAFTGMWGDWIREGVKSQPDKARIRL